MAGYKAPHPCQNCGHKAATGYYCWAFKVYVDKIDACPGGHWGIYKDCEAKELPKRLIVRLPADQ
jgi:hypothetical protein